MDRYKPRSNWYADYSEEGEFFGEIAGAITQTNYNRYVELHGEEKAQGYLQAIQDFQKEFYAVAVRGHSPVRVRNYIRNLYHHNSEFLKGMNEQPSAITPDKPVI